MPISKLLLTKYVHETLDRSYLEVPRIHFDALNIRQCISPLSRINDGFIYLDRADQVFVLSRLEKEFDSVEVKLGEVGTFMWLPNERV